MLGLLKGGHERLRGSRGPKHLSPRQGRQCRTLKPKCCHATLQEEAVTKDCEGCGAAGAPHSIRHVLRRLPRVLVLHLKRFQVRPGPYTVNPGFTLQGTTQRPRAGLQMEASRSQAEAVALVGFF